MPYLEYDNQADAWRDVVQRLHDEGVMTVSRGMETREFRDPTTLVIERPGAGFVSVTSGREFRHAITAVEGLSLVGQCSVPELMLDRVGAFAPYANDGIFWGAYGPRVAGDVGGVVDVLRGDPGSRQAVITIFDSGRDLARPSVRDVPCTIALQYRVRGTELDAWTVMRSNDAWLGLPYDLGQFFLLQLAIADALDLEVGRYYHTVGSMHLYEKDVARAEQLGASALVGPNQLFFRGGDIGGIAARARRILLGQVDKVINPSPLESWLAWLLS
jgi:thymidylate synthase